MQLLLTLFFWLFFGGISAYYAIQRGRNPYTWFLVGLFLGIIGLALLFILPNQKTAPQETAAPAPIKDPVPSPQSQKFWYYLDADNQQFGPMSHTALENALKEGKVTLTTFVWNEEMDGWKPYAEVQPLSS